MLITEALLAKWQISLVKIWDADTETKMVAVPRNNKILWMSVLGFFTLLYILVCISKFLPNSAVPIFPPPELEPSSLCDVRLREIGSGETGGRKPTLYFITPTYARMEQAAELTRLSQTLLHLDNVHWVVGEDSSQCSSLVSSLLKRSKLPFTHISSPQPDIYRTAKLKYNPRGVSSRRAGLDWVIKNRDPSEDGVVFFGDDDNTYDLRLLEEITTTVKVSMFPVGLIGEQGVSMPLVSPTTGKVLGFSDDWFAQRKFPVDMAGFAVNVKFMLERNKMAAQAMPYKAGYEEDLFLQSLNISLEDISPLASNCTEILVWHTKTVKEKVPLINPLVHRESQAAVLLDNMKKSGMAKTSKNGRKVKTCYDLNRCKT